MAAGRQRRAQYGRQLGGVGVLQPHHIDAAGAAAVAGRLLVQFADQRTHQGHAGRVGGAQDQRIAGRVGQQRGAKTAVGLAGGSACGRLGRAVGLDKLEHQRRQVGGDRMFQRNHLQVAGIGHVQRGDDAGDALQVVGVIGDHQRIGARVDVDGVVRADQRAQHWHQVVCALVVQLEDLGLHLAAAIADRTDRHRAALQLGIRLRHHLVQAGRFHHGKALQAQRRQKLVVGQGRRYRPLGQHGQLTLDARVYHHGAAGHQADGAGHGVNVGVDEIQRHRLAGLELVQVHRRGVTAAAGADRRRRRARHVGQHLAYGLARRWHGHGVGRRGRTRRRLGILRIRRCQRGSGQQGAQRQGMKTGAAAQSQRERNGICHEPNPRK